MEGRHVNGNELDGRVAIVTGGASGIGLATGRALGGHGARVVLADVEASALGAAVSVAGAIGLTFVH